MDFDLNQNRVYFENLNGDLIPALTNLEMMEVDRIAEEEFLLGVLQMMENAGRSLALHAMELCQPPNRILILAGPGGNGGGGLACMRHLSNHGFQVDLVLSRRPDLLSGAVKIQYTTIERSGFSFNPPSAIESLLPRAALVIDALLGYSLNGEPRGAIKDLILASNESSLPILSLDLPSGMNATSGDTPGAAIVPTRTLTLALPKRGLHKVAGRLFVADIGIPSSIYKHVGLEVGPLFQERFWFELRPMSNSV
jgi:NAD(P)H-hydrate epimerase